MKSTHISSICFIFWLYYISFLKSRIAELEDKLASGQTSHSVKFGSEKSHALPALALPPPLPLLERKDFPKVCFWTLKEWNDFKANQLRCNEAVHKLAFFHDEHWRPGFKLIFGADEWGGADTIYWASYLWTCTSHLEGKISNSVGFLSQQYRPQVPWIALVRRR